MNATQALLLAQLDSRKEGFTAGELATLVEKGETTVRENLKKLVVDGEVVKDGKNFRRTMIATPDTDAELDAAMREQMATPVPEDEVRPEHVEDEQSPEQADLEAALRASLEAQGVTPGETGSTDQPPADTAAEASETPAKKKYAPRRENPTRPIRKNQKTGSELQVVPQAELDAWLKNAEAHAQFRGNGEKTFPWYAICHTHSEFTGAKKIMAAWAFSTNPEKFCLGCRDALTAKA
jgi:hypothetical protein